MRTFFRRIVLVVAMALGLGALVQAGDPINKKKGLAVKGYDAVAYFSQGEPVKGDARFSFEWMGAKWLFASAENRDQFAADPEKYAPQFGGYCAYAASEGYLYDADPKFWRIVDGKLYLNYSGTAQKRWETDIPGNIEKANKHWPTLIK